jgi:hypothetical protein
MLRHPEHQSRSYTYKRSWREKNVTKIQNCHDVTFPLSGELKLLSLLKKIKTNAGEKIESIIFSGLLSF